MKGSSIFILFVVLTGVGIGAYFLLRPRPAYDLGPLKRQLQEMEKQLPRLGPVVDEKELPNMFLKQLALLDELYAEIAPKADNCAEMIPALTSFNQRAMKHFQLTGEDFQQIMNMRERLEKLGATIMAGYIKRLRLLIMVFERFAYSCPKDAKLLNPFVEALLKSSKAS